MHIRSALPLLGSLFLAAPVASAGEPTAADLQAEIIDDDPWGIGGGDVKARAIFTDGSRVRTLEFDVRSMRYASRLFKSLLRFNAPADVGGVGFLQVQKHDDDDDRYLYMPELHRSRRVAAVRRVERFMGTDYTYGDLDRRDLRNARAEIVGREKLGKYDVVRVALTPTAADALYGRIDVWVRSDNRRPLRYMLYDRKLVKVKTVTAREMRLVDGKWFTTRSLMQNHQSGSTTELELVTIRKSNYSDRDFTVGALERF